jgi:hypothetical protein
MCLLDVPSRMRTVSIVSHFCDEEGTLVWVGTKLSVLVLFNEDLVSHLILVGDSLGILPFVVLFDQVLFSILDQFPVGFELNIQDGIPAKH